MLLQLINTLKFSQVISPITRVFSNCTKTVYTILLLKISLHVNEITKDHYHDSNMADHILIT
jgi:hypothetical protein